MFEFDSNSADNELLERFVFSVKLMLVTIVNQGYQSLVEERTSLRIDPELVASARDALSEFVEQEQFERVLTALRAAERDILSLHGLTGAQLRFKLSGIESKERRFRLIPWIWSLRRLFDAVDNFLKSILTAIGASEAMNELKDAIFAATEDENRPEH